MRGRYRVVGAGAGRRPLGRTRRVAEHAVRVAHPDARRSRPPTSPPEPRRGRGLRISSKTVKSCASCVRIGRRRLLGIRRGGVAVGDLAVDGRPRLVGGGFARTSRRITRRRSPLRREHTGRRLAGAARVPVRAVEDHGDLVAGLRGDPTEAVISRFAGFDESRRIRFCDFVPANTMGARGTLAFGRAGPGRRCRRTRRSTRRRAVASPRPIRRGAGRSFERHCGAPRRAGRWLQPATSPRRRGAGLLGGLPRGAGRVSASALARSVAARHHGHPARAARPLLGGGISLAFAIHLLDLAQRPRHPRLPRAAARDPHGPGRFRRAASRPRPWPRASCSALRPAGRLTDQRAIGRAVGLPRGPPTGPPGPVAPPGRYAGVRRARPPRPVRGVRADALPTAAPHSPSSATTRA